MTTSTSSLASTNNASGAWSKTWPGMAWSGLVWYHLVGIILLLWSGQE